MTKDSDYWEIIKRGWFEKSEAAYTSAKILMEAGQLVGCVNRMYYAAFYAVSAVLAGEGKEYGKHTAVRGSLHRDYIRTGKIPTIQGQTYDDLFEDRQKGDYVPETSFDKNKIAALLEDTRSFIDCLKTLPRAAKDG